ncbi:hypothetical protein LJB95_03175 [Paludibacteraceae bacterium OttesenSCG-928-F17]|nr:hypothetical protein [Paludibacteraceae bacterium OttesenSCG-928-F17]
MAKANWCIVNPNTGSGNGTVNVSANVHTGRVQRTTSLTFKAAGVTDKTVSVNQQAKAEYVILNDITAEKAGGIITMTGKTNSAKLTFSLGVGDLVVTIPNNYLAGGANTANGANIAGDPGATAEFDFSIQFTVPVNNTVDAKTKTITVTATGGQTKSATITQAAGDPVLSVSPASITLDADGSIVAVTVSSNTEWTVE